MMKMDDKLRMLDLKPPPMQADFDAYWDSFSDWILRVVQAYANGDFE